MSVGVHRSIGSDLMLQLFNKATSKDVQSTDLPLDDRLAELACCQNQLKHLRD